MPKQIDSKAWDLAQQLAQQLAYSAASSDIECYARFQPGLTCDPAYENRPWVSEDKATVETAFEYLQLIGCLKPIEAFPGHFKILELKDGHSLTPEPWHDCQADPDDLPDDEIQVLVYASDERHYLAYMAAGEWFNAGIDEILTETVLRWQHLV